MKKPKKILTKEERNALQTVKMFKRGRITKIVRQPKPPKKYDPFRDG